MFITFEGPEGSGKSTQIRLLTSWLLAQNYDVVTTREPGGTEIGDQIRGVIMDVGNTGMKPSTEILLYSASRAQIVNELIAPALSDGKLVLCDRYADSTLAYQGYGRGLDLQDLVSITEFATGGLQPDLTFLLDIDVEVGLNRRIINDEEMNRLDLEAIAFHKRVRAGYHELVASDPDRWIVINADRSPEIIQTELQEILSNRL